MEMNVRKVVQNVGPMLPVKPRSHGSAAIVQMQLSDLTMLPRRAFIGNVALVRRGRLVEGDLVECGTWRGGMSAAMAWAVPGRHSVLFDSFEGLPEPKAVDRPARTVPWFSDESPQPGNLRADEASAIEAMKRVGQSDFEIAKGWFKDTVPAWAEKKRPIAVLRLDGDWYDSTILCLEQLWPLVSPGGIVIIDDYYTWDGCTLAVHDYLSRVQASERIEQSRYGVAYCVRQ
jgi:O-methyltransferase